MAGFFHSNLLYNKMIFIVLRISRCFQRAKVQDLDAIHNDVGYILIPFQVVFKEQKYKI